MADYKFEHMKEHLFVIDDHTDSMQDALEELYDYVLQQEQAADIEPHEWLEMREAYHKVRDCPLYTRLHEHKENVQRVIDYCHIKDKGNRTAAAQALDVILANAREASANRLDIK